MHIGAAYRFGGEFGSTAENHFLTLTGPRNEKHN